MNKVIMFILGAAAGSLVTWKIVSEKYKKIADAEIKSVVDYYYNKDENEKKEEELPVVEHVIERDDLDGVTKEYIRRSAVDIAKAKENTGLPDDEYYKKMKELGYNSEDDCVYIEPGVDYIRPYLISVDEYGDRDDLSTQSWTYYSDFVLTDGVGDIVLDPESVLGDSLEHFNGAQAIYVRNENVECDYEIIKVKESFSEINGDEA